MEFIDFNDCELPPREGVFKEYFDKFGEDPYIIGIHWNDRELLEAKIKKSIRKGVPYNEYEQLPDDFKELFDKGELLF